MADKLSQQGRMTLSTARYCMAIAASLAISALATAGEDDAAPRPGGTIAWRTDDAEPQRLPGVAFAAEPLFEPPNGPLPSRAVLTFAPDDRPARSQKAAPRNTALPAANRNEIRLVAHEESLPDDAATAAARESALARSRARAARIRREKGSAPPPGNRTPGIVTPGRLPRTAAAPKALFELVAAESESQSPQEREPVRTARFDEPRAERRPAVRNAAWREAPAVRLANARRQVARDSGENRDREMADNDENPIDCGEGAGFKKISDLTISISLSDEDAPQSCPLIEAPHTPREWKPVDFRWTASGMCYKPLYFEEPQVERYGHSFGVGPILQPFISGAHFFATVPLLPYKMGVDPPLECQYPLGYYRPGNCAPWVVPPFPLSWRGAAVQGAVVTGMFYGLP